MGAHVIDAEIRHRKEGREIDFAGDGSPAASCSGGSGACGSGTSVRSSFAVTSKPNQGWSPSSCNSTSRPARLVIVTVASTGSKGDVLQALEFQIHLDLTARRGCDQKSTGQCQRANHVGA
jgi:hypothetical protein